jgi:PTS system mannose-specific IIB component
LGEQIVSDTYAGLVRVDDRLIHGQVLVNWVRALALSRVVVVDDGLALDERARSILRAVLPGHVSLWVGPVSAVGAALVGFREPVDKHLVLVASPLTALALYDAYLHYIQLNVACLGFAPGKLRLLPQVSLTPAEFEVLGTLASRGVKVVSQAVPSDPMVRWPEIRARASHLLPTQVDRS